MIGILSGLIFAIGFILFGFLLASFSALIIVQIIIYICMDLSAFFVFMACYERM
jgi:hypothetical protein